METEPDLDMGRHRFTRSRRGSASRSWTWCLAKWIDTLVSVEETATQVQVMFEHALEVEGACWNCSPMSGSTSTPTIPRPILLAVLRQRSTDDRPRYPRLLLGCDGVAQHHGRPHTLQDQAWIETFFIHIKGEWPHLETITDPALLDAELARGPD